MNPFRSPTLQDYYARERETLASESTIRAELRELGVAHVDAEYDGVGDSGQVDQIRYRDDADPARPIHVDEQLNARVEALLYALLTLRHEGWENNDGAFGAFRWNLVNETIEHVHHQRYTDHDTAVHDGFEVNAGDLP